MKKILVLLLVVIISIPVVSQQTGKANKLTIEGVSVVNPLAKPTSFAPKLDHLEAPLPGGNSYRSFLNEQKKKSAKLYPPQKNKTSIDLGKAENPVMIHEMNMRKFLGGPIQQEGIYNGGTPLDNTMAVGKQYLLASVNSFLWAYDIQNDSNAFIDENGSTYNISFAEFGKDYIESNQEFPFDPKLVYIPEYDKFIFLFLSGRGPSDSKIIIGFSSTDDPRDPWYVYKITGNPRNTDTWTDFPMIAFDQNNLFLTINLLQENFSWQEGFRGSIIWKIPMEDGFSGDSTLNTTWFDDINWDGKPIRNLTPVQHQGNDLNTEQGVTFLSNRNFDIQNDSLFIIEVNGDDQVSISQRQLPSPYGVAPNGIQANDNPNDETDGLQTNDARFLSAVSYINSKKQKYIEFVGNTKDFSTGRAAIYHGKIRTPDSALEGPVSVDIIGVDSLDFGYPNLVYVNNGMDCYEGTFIAFNHTSATTNAGVSGILHHNTDGYSDIMRLKEGDGYVNRMAGTYERWGDYFGIQTLPGEPGKLYTSGFYGTDKNSSSTWFSLIGVADSNTLMVGYTEGEENENFPCEMEIEFTAYNGFEPYTYTWVDGSNTNAGLVNICDSFFIAVEDAKGCILTQSNPPKTITNYDVLYPNPVVDQFSINFRVNQNTKATFVIYDVTGKLIAVIAEKEVPKGNNTFSFSVGPLNKGVYFLRIMDTSENILSDKPFVKL